MEFGELSELLPFWPCFAWRPVSADPREVWAGRACTEQYLCFVVWVDLIELIHQVVDVVLDEVASVSYFWEFVFGELDTFAINLPGDVGYEWDAE